MADQIKLPGIVLADGTKVKEGWHDVELSEIDAVYHLNGGNIEVKEHGNMTGTCEGDMVVEAPEHYSIVNGKFSGQVLLKNIDQPLEFENNKLINGSAS